MKKIKLSTVNINANTLNGQDGNYYNFRNLGLGSQTSSNDVADLNANLNTGFYGATTTTLNSPGSASFSIIHIKRGDGYAFQLAIRASSSVDVIYIRRLVAYNWEVWKVLA